jgi:hypothetical protein
MHRFVPASCPTARQPLGGGIGSGNFNLLPETRSFFKISGGLDPIPYNKAASVSISIIPQYVQSASP